MRGVKPEGRRKEGEAKGKRKREREREGMKGKIEDEGRGGRSLEGHEQRASSGNCSKSGRALLIRARDAPVMWTQQRPGREVEAALDVDYVSMTCRAGSSSRPRGQAASRD